MEILNRVKSSEPQFFYVSETRFMAMSILSFGIFNSYWMYKNWQFLKNRDNLDIMPFWRGIFGIFFIHSLLNKIEADKGLSEVERSNFSGSTLATIWVVLLISSNLLSRLDDTNFYSHTNVIGFRSFYSNPSYRLVHHLVCGLYHRILAAHLYDE